MRGLLLRVAGTEVGAELGADEGEYAAEERLRRWGTESLLVNVGRGMLAGGGRVHRLGEWLRVQSGPFDRSAPAKYCLMMRRGLAQSGLTTRTSC